MTQGAVHALLMLLPVLPGEAAGVLGPAAGRVTSFTLHLALLLMPVEGLQGQTQALGDVLIGNGQAPVPHKYISVE